MKTIFLLLLFFLLQAVAILAFLFSCVITLTDGQGALIFVFTIPAMIVLQAISWPLAIRMKKNSSINFPLVAVPKGFLIFLALFFVLMFMPVLDKVPHTILQFSGVAFKAVTGKTPRAYFQERNSFPNLLSRSIGNSSQKQIDFSSLGMSFAWDRVCIFGPYTNNAKAKSILNLDWNIEERSEIHSSDSVNALVFLFQGKVNQVVDLKRGVVDFSDLDICLERNQAVFLLSLDANGRRIFRPTMDREEPKWRAKCYWDELFPHRPINKPI